MCKSDGHLEATLECELMTDKATDTDPHTTAAPDHSVAATIPGDPPIRKKPTDELLDEEHERSAQAMNIRSDLFDEDEYSMEEYEQLLDMYEESIQDIQEGSIVTGHILRV